jgi:predicted site-specific integrase-resolvase
MNTSNITNYKPKDFAELLGVSVKTLQRWDREGTLKANRTPTDRRYYTYDQYLQFKGINIENDKRQVVIYARVSTRNQKDDLQNQVAFLRQFCNAKGIIIDQCIEDYGSGLNYNRKKWNELLNEVMEQKIKTIIVTHKDRFIRFGYEVLLCRVSLIDLHGNFNLDCSSFLEDIKEKLYELKAII